MRIRPYNKDTNYSHLVYLLQMRDMPVTLMEDLPEFGLVAWKEDFIVAAGFIRKIEGNYAMLDSYITNPTIDSSARNRALDLITKKLIKIANTYGTKALLAFSADPNTQVRATQHGFVNFKSHLFQVLKLK